MTNTLTGRCLCGAVTATLAEGPRLLLQCHCDDCRRAVGGGPAHIAMVDRALVAIHGRLERYTVTGASGGAVTRCFCPVCGSPTHSELEKYPDKLVLKVGLFDADALGGPTMAIWTASAPRWHAIPDALHRFEQGRTA